jgi:hypothetical protein
MWLIEDNYVHVKNLTSSNRRIDGSFYVLSRIILKIIKRKYSDSTRQEEKKNSLLVVM